MNRVFFKWFFSQHGARGGRPEDAREGDASQKQPPPKAHAIRSTYNARKDGNLANEPVRSVRVADELEAHTLGSLER